MNVRRAPSSHRTQVTAGSSGRQSRCRYRRKRAAGQVRRKSQIAGGEIVASRARCLPIAPWYALRKESDRRWRHAPAFATRRLCSEEERWSERRGKEPKRKIEPTDQGLGQAGSSTDPEPARDRLRRGPSAARGPRRRLLERDGPPIPESRAPCRPDLLRRRRGVPYF